MQKKLQMVKELSEQEIVRRESLQKLRELGINPYPANMFNVNNSSLNIKNSYVKDSETEVTIEFLIKLRLFK